MQGGRSITHSSNSAEIWIHIFSEITHYQYKTTCIWNLVFHFIGISVGQGFVSWHRFIICFIVALYPESCIFLWAWFSTLYFATWWKVYNLFTSKQFKPNRKTMINQQLAKAHSWIRFPVVRRVLPDYIWVTQWRLIKNRNCIPFASTWVHSRF